MTTKHQPATPLPWVQPTRYSPEDGIDLPIGAVEGLDRSGVIVACYSGHEPSQVAQNASYIVHVANAYPRLVGALRDLRGDEWRCTVDWGPREERQNLLNSIDALLRELGEE